MNNKYDESLKTVGEETFESLAFMLMMDDDACESAGDGNAATARITFSGPFEGAVYLGASAGVLPAVAANMLGLEFDEAPEDAVQHDAFKELLNVICGNLLPRIAGSQAVFDVRPAEILAPGPLPTQHENCTLAGKTTMLLDEGKAELALFVAGDAASA